MLALKKKESEEIAIKMTINAIDDEGLHVTYTEGTGENKVTHEETFTLNNLFGKFIGKLVNFKTDTKSETIENIDDEDDE